MPTKKPIRCLATDKEMPTSRPQAGDVHISCVDSSSDLVRTTPVMVSGEALKGVKTFKVVLTRTDENADWEGLMYQTIEVI